MINRGSRLLMSLVIIALLVGAWVAVPRGVVSRTQAAAPIADLDEISRLVQYVNSHVTGLSKNEASQLILQLEEAQRRYLPSLESRYYAQEDLGAVFFESYVAGVDPNHMDLIAEGELKELLWATHAGGFKVETAEGTFYPVIDYSRYEKYTLLVTDDIAEYIRIMAREITQPAAKDAALLIGWDEILSRALQQERFITKYPHSPRIKEVKELYARYVYLVLYGTDNTPLFTHAAGSRNNRAGLAPAAKLVYSRVGQVHTGSELARSLGEWMERVKADDFLLTPQVEAQRELLRSRLTD